MLELIHKRLLHLQTQTDMSNTKSNGKYTVNKACKSMSELCGKWAVYSFYFALYYQSWTSALVSKEHSDEDTSISTLHSLLNLNSTHLSSTNLQFWLEIWKTCFSSYTQHFWWWINSTQSVMMIIHNKMLEVQHEWSSVNSICDVMKINYYFSLAFWACENRKMFR